MWIPKEIGRMATRLKEGHRVNRITVRELLRMFKAERRGLNKVHDIRTALDSLGLVTDPDFESVWIDKKIRIRLKDASNLIAVVAPAGDAESIQEDELDEEQSLSEAEQDETDSQQPGSEEGAQPAIVLSSEGVVETVLSEPADPTFRIGSLPAANKALTTVGQDDHLKKAVTMMLQFDYSQLPIMHGEREVKGMISWKSIASRYAIGGECCKVQHCREDAQVVDGNGTLFDAIPTIVKHGYVLVRNPQDRKITGIVTASDLSLQFQQLAEPFLLLREIELHIRQLLQDKVLAEDLDWLGSADTTAPKPNSMSDLSFGGYIRLVQRPQVWQRLALNIDQASLTKQLEDVRQIRNDVMHFDPDPLTTKQLDVLKNAAKFMQQLYELLP
jgi:predicted transcriptional regulator